MSSFSIDNAAVKSKTATIKTNINNINNNISQILTCIIEMINNGYWTGAKANRFYNNISNSLLSNKNNTSVSKLVEKSNNICSFLDKLIAETEKVEAATTETVKKSSSTKVETTTTSKTGTKITISSSKDTLWNLAVKNGYNGADWQKIFRDANGNVITQEKASKLKLGDTIILVGLSGATTTPTPKTTEPKLDAPTTKVDKAKASSSDVSKATAQNNKDIPKRIKGTYFAQTQYGRYYWDKSSSNGYGPEFLNKVKAIAKEHNLDYKELLALFASESYSLKPSQQNMGGQSYYGFMQMGKDACANCGVTTTQLKNMTPIQQLDVINKHLYNLEKSMPKNSQHRIEDYYAANYLPARCGRETLANSSEGYYKWNPGLDVNKDGYITKSDLRKTIYNSMVDERCFTSN